MTKNSSFISIAYFLVIVALLWILSFFPECSISTTYQLVANMLLSCMTVHYTCPYVKRIFFSEKVSSANKAVLITGCNSVVGQDLAKRLDSKGFRVLASCLPSGDEAKALQKTCSNSLKVLDLDVSKDESVEKALAYVKQHLNGSKLWAIVNIADMEKGFEWTRVQDFRDGMDIDAMGIVRVTKAFLPLLRMSRGRVVTVINLAARPSKPRLSSHCMSTFATSCFCDCLRKEMHPRGVKVVTIESDLFRAAITNWKLTEPKRDAVIEESVDEESKEEYGENYVEAYKELAKRALIHDSSQIDKVIECSENAVMLEEPWYVYRLRGDIFYRLVLGILESLPKPFAYIFSHFVIYILGTTEPKKAE